MGSSKDDPKKGEFEGTTSETIIVAVISFFLPPLGVALLRGFGAKVIITFLLTLLAYIPGIIYAELELAIWFSERRDQRKKEAKQQQQAVANGQMAQQQNGGYQEPTYGNYQQQPPPPQQWQGQPDPYQQPPGPYPPQPQGPYSEMPAPPQAYNKV